MDIEKIYNGLLRKFPLCRVWFVPFPGHFLIRFVDGREQVMTLPETEAILT